MMKKEILPVGYNAGYKNMIAFVIIDIVLIGFLIVSKVGFSEKDFAETLKIVIAGIIVTVPFFIRSALKASKCSKMVNEREKRKQKSEFSVDGKITEIKSEWLNNQYAVVNTPSIGVPETSDKQCYRLTVSYTDPSDGFEKTAESEYYNVFEQELNNSKIKVYGNSGSNFPLIAVYKN